MSNICKTIMLFLLVTFIAACTSPATNTPLVTSTAIAETSALVLPEIKISRHPDAADFRGLNIYTEPPTYDPSSTEQWQVDLRSSDLTKLDLSKSKEALLFADFDSKTQWPTSDKMPADFDWQKIMEIGKDPGLGIRSLHEQGITGKDIGFAIIDQPLLIEHQEYKDRFHLYEEINILPDTESQMHGPAVTSIAVGKTVGVAPEANLYYIGTWTGDWGTGNDDFTWNFKYYAQAVRRILEINRTLPEGRKIRVIAMQVGWDPSQAGYDEITAAVNEAKAAGIFVVSSSLSETYGLHFHGLGRGPLSDPNEFQSYQPGSWWQKDFYEHGLPAKVLLVPMDARTTASPTGTKDYVYYRQGGWSWSIPYLAGVYVLAAQVKPDITPEEFWERALETGRTIQIQHEGKDYKLGVILDPQALIKTLKNK
jgi:hypothetical protein